VMERHLSSHAWFTGDFYGIADIALFAYTCVAGHGGIDLDRYPAIRDWLVRISEVPGYVPLPRPDATAQALIDQSA
jgi:glutathione S-transferase